MCMFFFNIFIQIELENVLFEFVQMRESPYKCSTSGIGLPLFGDMKPSNKNLFILSEKCRISRFVSIV